MTKKEQLDSLLADLRNSGGVEGAAVVSKDGLIIASLLDAGVDSDIFGAMSATMNGAAETAMGELKKGMPDRVLVEAAAGKLIAVGAGENSILVVLSAPSSSLGMLLVEMKKTAERVRELIG